MKRADPEHEAAAWVDRFSQSSIDTDALEAFFAWRRQPANRTAFDSASKARRRARARFRVEPDPFGFSVIDGHTAEPAGFANRPQTGISKADAEAIAEVLNRRALSDRGSKRA